MKSKWFPVDSANEKQQQSVHAEAWRELLEEIKNIDTEPVSEFERIKLREIEI